MHTTKERFATVLAALAIGLSLTASASAQVNMTSRSSPIAGQWEGTFEAASIIAADPDRNLQWVGPMTAQIDAKGKIDFLAENGCRFRGTLVPIMNTLKGKAVAQACEEADFNRSYTINAMIRDDVLYVQLSAITFDAGSADQNSWAFGGALRRYE